MVFRGSDSPPLQSMETEMGKAHFLDDEKVVVGSWITLGHPAIAEIMCNSGFDWLAVDLEHSVITIREAEELIRVIDLSGVVPFVRLTANSTSLIKRVMDAGAHGVIVPMVKTARDAKQAVAAVKYPPIGERGIGLARAQKYGAAFEEYRSWQTDNTIVIVQIEHIDAVDNFEQIMAVPGVDGFIVGPYDLSASMGLAGQFEDPKFVRAMDRIKQLANKTNSVGGVHIIEPEPSQLVQKISEGYRFIAYSLDIRMLDQSCRFGLSGVS